MRVFLTGATGFVGGHALRRLLQDGYAVRALARSTAAAARLGAAGAEVLTLPLPDADRLGAGLAGCQAVVHCAAHLRMAGPSADFEAGNVGLTRALLQAARSAGLQRFVHLSAASVVMQGPAPLIDVDEDAPTTRLAALPYSRTKALAEALVLAASSQHLHTIALRPPLVWGPGDTVDGELGRRIARGQFGWFDGGRFPYATCHVDNLCEAISLALRAPAHGVACFVTDGEPVELRHFLTRRIDANGLAAPRLSVPTSLAWQAAGALQALWQWAGLPSDPPLTREAVRLLGCPFTVRIHRAQQILAYQPVLSVDDGLQRLRARRSAGALAGADPTPPLEAR